MKRFVCGSDATRCRRPPTRALLMPDQPSVPTPMPAPVPPPPGHRRRRGSLADLFALRRDVPAWQQAAAGLLCVALVFAAWWFVTRGETDEEHILSGMPSPAET